MCRTAGPYEETVSETSVALAALLRSPTDRVEREVDNDTLEPSMREPPLAAICKVHENDV